MSTARCACGECGGVSLLPVGVVFGWRGAPIRVSGWAPQDHWNVPCRDAEGAVGINRTAIDGGPAYTRDDIDRAVGRTAFLAGMATDPAERARLIADRAAWLALSFTIA